jgi:hypothetical protein
LLMPSNAVASVAHLIRYLGERNITAPVALTLVKLSVVKNWRNSAVWPVSMMLMKNIQILLFILLAGTILTCGMSIASWNFSRVM